MSNSWVRRSRRALLETAANVGEGTRTHASGAGNALGGMSRWFLAALLTMGAFIRQERPWPAPRM